MNAMLIALGPKVQGGLSLEVGLEKKLLIGTCGVDKSSMATLGCAVCDPFLARVDDDEMKGPGNAVPHSIELAPSWKDLLASSNFD